MLFSREKSINYLNKQMSWSIEAKAFFTHPVIIVLLALFVIGIVLMILGVTGVISASEVRISPSLPVIPTVSLCTEPLTLFQTLTPAPDDNIIAQDLTPSGANWLLVQSQVGASTSCNYVLYKREPGAYTAAETLPNINDSVGGVARLKYQALQASVPQPTSGEGQVRLYHRASTSAALFNTFNTLSPPIPGGSEYGVNTYFTGNNVTDTDEAFFVAQRVMPDGGHGALHIYEQVTTVPTLIQTLTAPSPVAGDEFGARSYIQRNTWMVTSSPQEQLIYAYYKPADTKTWLESAAPFQSETPSETVATDLWISTTGRVIIVGQADYPVATPGANQGRVEIFSRPDTNSNFTSSKVITEPGGPVNNSRFGLSLTPDADGFIFMLIPGHTSLPGVSPLLYIYRMHRKTFEVDDLPVETIEYGVSGPSPTVTGQFAQFVRASPDIPDDPLKTNDFIIAASSQGTTSSVKLYLGCLALT